MEVGVDRAMVPMSLIAVEGAGPVMVVVWTGALLTAGPIAEADG